MRDIRQQPHSLRMVMFALSLITTLSIVALLWVGSFQRDLYALLDAPALDAEADRLAAEPVEPSRSPFAFLKDAFSNTANSLFGLISGGSKKEDSPESPPIKKTRPYVFPLSDPR